MNWWPWQPKQVLTRTTEIAPPEYFIVAQASLLGVLWARSLRKAGVDPA